MFYSVGFILDWVTFLVVEGSKFWVYVQKVTIGPFWILVPDLLILAWFAIWISRRVKSVRGVTRFLNGAATIAILISLAISLTTTPMMCAFFLKSRPPREGPPPRTIFTRVLAGYQHSLAWALNHSRLVLLIFVGAVASNLRRNTVARCGKRCPHLATFPPCPIFT